MEATPPVREALIGLGVPHVYRVPTGIILPPPEVGVTEKDTPEQTVVETG